MIQVALLQERVFKVLVDKTKFVEEVRRLECEMREKSRFHAKRDISPTIQALLPNTIDLGNMLLLLLIVAKPHIAPLVVRSIWVNVGGVLANVLDLCPWSIRSRITHTAIRICKHRIRTMLRTRELDNNL